MKSSSDPKTEAFVDALGEGQTFGPAPEGNHLLMHMCCGPCACICLKVLLEEGWNITGFWHNPNIQPLAEYLRRREAELDEYEQLLFSEEPVEDDAPAETPDAAEEETEE